VWVLVSLSPIIDPLEFGWLFAFLIQNHIVNLEAILSGIINKIMLGRASFHLCVGSWIIIWHNSHEILKGMDLFFLCV
jgi:hypothetical protein